MKPIPRVICALLLLLICATLSFGTMPFRSYQKGRFLIFSAPEDSSYRREIFRVLERAYDEITFDLKFYPDDTLSIYIAPSRKSFLNMASGSLPEWVAAYAVPTHNSMVLKSPRWSRDDSFEITLRHELTHLIIHNYMNNLDLPRWLDEGLAIFYSKEQRWKTDPALSKAVASRSLIPLEQIDLVLDYHRSKADLAYQQSWSATDYLMRTYDVEAVRQLLTGLKHGHSLDQCFLEATGSTFAAFEAEWHDYVAKHAKYVWFYEIDQYLWFFIFVLAALAFAARYLRNRQILSSWREDEIEAPAPKVVQDESTEDTQG